MVPRLTSLRAALRAGSRPAARTLATSPAPPARLSGRSLALGLAVGVGVGLGSSLVLARAEAEAPKTVEPVQAKRTNDGKKIHSFGSPADYDCAIAELKTHFSEDDGHITTDIEDREVHGGNEHTWDVIRPPTAVVYPGSTEEVQTIMRVASKYRVPIIPYGGGTSLEGHFSAPYGGICVNLSRMDKVLAIHAMDGDCVVQAGVSYDALNDALKNAGHALFLPLDPGPGATVGGMISTGCSGTNSIRYGTARAEWFLNVTAVLPDGTVVKTRQRARKSSTGPDMTKLFIGAEGTLGIVTEATVRLAPRLPTRVAVVGFPSVRDAVTAVVDVLGEGVNVQCAELLDDLHIKAVNHMGIVPHPLPVADSIFFKLQGNDEQVAESARMLTRIVKRHGGGELTFAKDDKDGEAIWNARRSAVFAALAHSGYEMVYGNDVCVPVSRLPDLVDRAKEEFKSLGIYAPTFGHVGDGNLHCNIIIRDRSEVPMVRDVMGRLIYHAINDLDGTCTGEHGVGMTKKKYLPTELGAGTVALLRSIKDTVDPLGIMNPGKLYPDEQDIPLGDWEEAAPRCC